MFRSTAAAGLLLPALRRGASRPQVTRFLSRRWLSFESKNSWQQRRHDTLARLKKRGAGKTASKGGEKRPSFLANSKRRAARAQNSSRDAPTSGTKQKRASRLFQLSPFARNDLRFDSYPKRPDWLVRSVLGGFIGVNGAIFLLWNTEWADSALWQDQFMRKFFLWNNTSLEDGHWWTLFTPSVSHMEWGHIVGNMFFFAVFGGPIFHLVGGARLLALYLGGAMAGTIATECTSTYDPERIASSVNRYHNAIMGLDLGDVGSLGASDSVMAMAAVFYWAFPRAKIPLSRNLWMMKKLFGSGGKQRLFSSNPSVSAIWYLPSLFLFDFIAVASSDSVDNEDHTNHAAHVGGFLFGTAFYFAAVRPIKLRHAPHLAIERDPRRWYLMALSATAYGLLYYAMLQLENHVPGVQDNKVAEDGEASQKKEHGPETEAGTGPSSVTFSGTPGLVLGPRVEYDSLQMHIPGIYNPGQRIIVKSTFVAMKDQRAIDATDVDMHLLKTIPPGRASSLFLATPGVDKLIKQTGFEQYSIRMRDKIVLSHVCLYMNMLLERCFSCEQDEACSHIAASGDGSGELLHISAEPFERGACDEHFMELHKWIMSIPSLEVQFLMRLMVSNSLIVRRADFSDCVRCNPKLEKLQSMGIQLWGK